MKKLSLLTLLVVVASSFSGVAQAQDAPVLYLAEEHLGQTFSVTTGTVINVSLTFSDLHVSYDPTKLHFLSYAPPETLTGTTDTGVIEPEGIAPEPLPTEIMPGSEGDVGSGVGVAVAGSAPTVGGGETNLEDVRATWRFLAVGAGTTSLELQTFYPPCPEDQPCPMMPDFLASFTLVIEGATLVPEPESIDGEIIVVKAQPTEPTLTVQPGQIVLFDVAALEPPFHVIYHPAALRLLAGEDLRFLANPWGMMTRIGAQSADGTLFAATLLIEPECDSCGVFPGAPGQAGQ
jgi:hypothetical protein